MTVSEVEVVQGEPGPAVVRFIGEHDLTSSEKADALLTSLLAQNTVVVADLRQATFIDSSFIHCLAKADIRAREQGGRFRIQLGDNSAIQRVFEISGLLEKLDYVAEEDDPADRPESPAIADDLAQPLDS